MHSRLFLITQDDVWDEENILTAEEIKIDFADYISRQSVDNFNKDLDFLSSFKNLCLNRYDNSFKLTNEALIKWQREIYRKRKSDIRKIIEQKTFNYMDLYRIASIAQPRYGVLFQIDNDDPQGIEDFILQEPGFETYYIMQSYDYHF